jgi:CHAT domain-containing protein
MKTAGRRRAARGEPFHILHFIGHGGFDKVVEDGVLHFEDATGMSDPIQGYLLGNTLRDHTSLRLAVLNACEGARQSVEDPFQASPRACAGNVCLLASLCSSKSVMTLH